MRTVAQYLALIPPYNAQDANFMAELQLVLQPFADQQLFLASLPDAFSVDNAVGVQLDVVGQWVGISRNIPVPLPNPWFNLDFAGLGFDQGFWWGPYEGSHLSTLDDTTYRRLIRAVILANNCDGSRASIQAALAEYLSIYPGLHLAVIDETDGRKNPHDGGTIAATNLSMGIVISGAIPTPVDLSILQQFLIPVKPAGVAIDWGVTTVFGAPTFGFDVENATISGFDVGAWGATPQYVADNITSGSALVTGDGGLIITGEGGQITVEP